MMKKILYICIGLVSIIGCANGQNKVNIKELRDSLDKVFFMGYVRNDTIILKRALELSNYLLSVDTSNIGKRQCYYYRSRIFFSLGRMDEAMANGEHAVLTLQENNPLRLIFMSVKYLRENNKDSATYYIEKINAVCDSSLNDEYNQDMAINKIKAIYLRDGEKNAKIYLSKLLRTHPSPLLKSLNEDWNEWVRMNNEEFELMNIKTLR
jgi:tetratricopeptide (TPR) repeat protein